MADFALTGCQVLRSGGILERGTVVVEEGQISRVVDPSEHLRMPTIDAAGQICAPGFVDVHINGAGGASFDSCDPSGFDTILETGFRYGTTSVLAAINTAPEEDRIAQLEALASYDSTVCGQVLGVHLEGPYYSPAQPGAHRPEWLRDPDPAEYGVWLERFADLVRVVTLAPELEGGIDLVRTLCEAGVVAAIGHSMATDAQVDEAIEAGASLVTHIYNAQSTYTRTDTDKYLGVAEMALLRDELTVEMIPDNRHLTPRMQQLVLKAKSHDKICITTDAIEAAGQGPGKYQVMGGVVWVDEEVAYREDRTRHAGSILTMDRAVRNIVAAGAPIGDALMMASEIPARTIGVDDRKGVIREGADADLVILDEDLIVDATVCGGDVVYSAEGSPLSQLPEKA